MMPGKSKSNKSNTHFHPRNTLSESDIKKKLRIFANKLWESKKEHFKQQFIKNGVAPENLPMAMMEVQTKLQPKLLELFKEVFLADDTTDESSNKDKPTRSPR